MAINHSYIPCLYPYSWVRLEIPLLRAAQRLHVDAARNVDALRQLVDVLQRALDSVKDVVQDTGSELNGQGRPCSEHGVTNANTSCEHFGGLLKENYGMRKLSIDIIENFYRHSFINGRT